MCLGSSLVCLSGLVIYLDIPVAQTCREQREKGREGILTSGTEWPREEDGIDWPRFFPLGRDSVVWGHTCFVECMGSSCIVSTPLQPVCLQTAQICTTTVIASRGRVAGFFQVCANFSPFLCLQYKFVSLSHLCLATSSHLYCDESKKSTQCLF